MKLRTSLVAAVQLVAVAARAQSLDSPAVGEWPMFKRTVSHQGFVPAGEMTGRIDSPCLKWRTELAPLTDMSGQPNVAQNYGLPLIAKVGNTWTVYIVTQGYCTAGGGCTDDKVARVWALDARTGLPLRPPTRLEYGGFSSTSRNTPLIANVDDTGPRELVVPADGSNVGALRNNRVYILRTEDEAGGLAGSIKWVYEFPADSTGSWNSEAAPTAVDLTGDGVPEVILPAALAQPDGGTQRAGKLFAIDVRNRESYSFTGEARSGSCTALAKMDSASPAITWDGDEPVIVAGDWAGWIYGIHFRNRALVTPLGWRKRLDDYPSASGCLDAKVRSSPVAGSYRVGGAQTLTFGFMYEPDPRNVQDFATAKVGILAVTHGSGFGALASLPITGWKSSPSLAPPQVGGTDWLALGGRWRQTGGQSAGVYGIASTALGYTWQTADVGDGNAAGLNPVGGNRSSPAVANIDGDNNYEMIIGVEGNSEPGLHAYQFGGGQFTSRWYQPLPLPGSTSSPAVGNLGDDTLEVVTLGHDGVLYAVKQKPTGANTCPATSLQIPQP